MKKVEKEAVLDKIAGPVTASLPPVLNKHNIVVQAFHSRSFTGNHCVKYLRPDVYTDICKSIVVKTKSLTSDKKIIRMAKATSFKFQKLNEMFSKVHSEVSHGNPVDDVDDIEDLIKVYMAEIRVHFPLHVTPKLHFLEHHIVPWMKRYGFAMALHGEQGIESSHREFNRLNMVMHGIPDELRKTTAVMREHIVSTHPRINKFIIHPKKRIFKVSA